MHPIESFTIEAKKIESPVVLELGTYRSVPTRSTLHKHFVPHYKEWIGSDITPGDDVDIIADAHRLSKFISPNSIDIIISCSTFEHFKYPFVAAFEMLKVLKVGGLIFIQTHHCFRLHSYPYDYFRFSTDALKSLFGTKNGVEVIDSGYEFKVQIISDRVDQQEDWLNSLIVIKKTHETPSEFQYDWDTNIGI